MSKRSEAEGVMFAKRIKALQDYIDFVEEAIALTFDLRLQHKFKWPKDFPARGRKLKAAIDESRKITA